MVEFDIQNLLSEISAETPCGEDISYDQGYLALELLVRPRQTGGGVLGQKEALEEPNWRDVYEKSCELLTRSKDLRVGTYLTLALLKLNGISGLSDGLSLLNGLLERLWDHVHPQLDPDDANDPLERINILQSLSPPSVDPQDPIKLRQRLCEVSLCSSPSMGRFCYRDVQIAKGEITASDDQAAKTPDMSVIDAAFQDTPTHELQATLQVVEDAIERTAAIVDIFSERASQAQSPNLNDLETLLVHIRKFVQGYLVKRGLGAPVEDTEMASADIEEQGGGVLLSGSIRSREEALMAMEKACRYFERNEPSSPVPMLLRRAQRLVAKDFLQVIMDVCPEALSSVQAIGGVSGGSSDSDTEY